MCLFPDGILSLNIFEIRYLKMIRAASDEKKCFGIILLQRGLETNTPGEIEEFYDIGTRLELFDLKLCNQRFFR